MCLRKKSAGPFQHFVFPISLRLSHVGSWSRFSPIRPQFLCSQTSLVQPWLWPAISLRFAVGELDKKPESRFMLSGMVWRCSRGLGPSPLVCLLQPSSLQGCSSCSLKPRWGWYPAEGGIWGCKGYRCISGVIRGSGSSQKKAAALH